MHFPHVPRYIVALWWFVEQRANGRTVAHYRRFAEEEDGDGLGSFGLYGEVEGAIQVPRPGNHQEGDAAVMAVSDGSKKCLINVLQLRLGPLFQPSLERTDVTLGCKQDYL